jgi:para-aminobenzoate synthetase/4-amino-4-deoxychorismate lyase
VVDLLSPDPSAGVFETLLVVRGSLVELDAHLQRLRDSVRELFGAELPDGSRELALEHAAGLSIARLRLTVAPGADDLLRADVITADVDRDNVFPSWERSITLRSFPVSGWSGAHKWADRAGLAAMEASLPGGELPVLLESEELLEASRANLFAVDGETLLTPPADGRILPGVARARAIAAARTLGIEVREQPLSADSVLAAGEAFLTGSVRGVEPVHALGETELSKTGPTVARLAAEMRRIWIGDAVLAQAP